MAATRRLSELTSSALAVLELPRGPLTVALSGGADSACLAYLSIESGVETRGVHVDHGLPASSLMADAAAAVAVKVGVALETVSVDVDVGPSLEERAREARYRVLEAVGGPVITAHTSDDSAETMLINLIRGTGPTGLTGIPQWRPPNIYRPMLAVTRDQTREIATLAGLPFAEDPMNDDLSLTRNRVRHEVLPGLRELNPKIDTALARTASILARDTEFLESLVPDIGEPAAPAAVVITLPRSLADRLLHRLLEASGVGPTAERIERMWSVASGESDRQELAGGRAVVRRGAMIVVE